MKTVRSMAIKRDRGLGDVLMLTPSLRALVEGYYAERVVVYCNDKLRSVFQDNPYVDDARDAKLFRIEAPDFERVVDLTGYAERQADVSRLSRVYLFGRGLGVDGSLVTGETRLDYFVRSGELLAARNLLAGMPEKVVSLSPFSRDDRRSWSLNQVQRFVDLCRHRGIGVVITHSNAEYDGVASFHLPGVRFFWGLETRMLAALLLRMKCVVSVDTGVYHLAVAVGGEQTPPLVLSFASTDAEVQMAPYEDQVRYAAVPVGGASPCEHYPCAAGVITSCHREAPEKLSCTHQVSADAVFEQVVNFIG